MKSALVRFWRNRQLRSLVVVICASILERADVAALPAVFSELGVDLRVSPAALGSFKLVQLLTQAITSPFAVYLAVRYQRTKVIASGALVCTVATFGIAMSTTFAQVAFNIALNSLGVSVTWPAIQSLVADSTDGGNRGTTFGFLQLTGHMGTFFGGFMAVLLSGTSVMGITGWRVAFFILSALSFVIAISVYLLAEDPDESNSSIVRSEEVKVFASGEFWEVVNYAKKVMELRTFQVIVAQGVVGSFAFAALSFSPMWLELIGFSHPQTAAIIGFFIVAGSLGGVWGGWIGDRVSARLPDSGRIAMSQISIGSAVPLTAILLLGLPENSSTALLHGFVFFVTGLCISWSSPATKDPIMAEIVPKELRTTIYALERSTSSILSAFSPPLVGIMAEKIFGYVPVPKGTDENLGVDLNRKNATALAKALYAAIGPSFLVCALIFTLLYWTYPIDRDNALKKLTAHNLKGSVRLEDIENNNQSLEEEAGDGDETSHILPRSHEDSSVL